LYWLIQIARAARLGPSLPIERRLRDDTARLLWSEMQRLGGITYASRARMHASLNHTDAVLAVDRHGSIAVLCHSINTMAWGSTGMFVGGVSVPDSASFQQSEIAQAGPGRRLPDLMNPVLVMRDDRPASAAACIGSSLHETMLQFLVNTIDFKWPIARAAEAPQFLVPIPGLIDRVCAGAHHSVAWAPCLLRRLIISTAMLTGHPRRAISPAQAIENGVFPASVTESVIGRGQRLTAVTGAELLGYLAAIAFDVRASGVHAVVTMMPFTDGSAVGD
jgi:gamma-glutamyltranspeptidase/glutathione hydrolase